MKALSDLKLFVLVAESRSLSEAARCVDVTPAAASAAIKRLEEELQIPLFVRTTRNLRLTGEGETFLEDCRAAIDLIGQAKDRLSASGQGVQGVVNLALPSDLGNNVVMPWLHEFRQRHPQVRLRLLVSDRVSDVMRLSLDVALRYGDQPDSSMVSLPIMPNNRRILCAAPSYIERHGAPSTPHELVSHNCLCFMLSERTHNHWTFTRGAKIVEVDVSGTVQSDNGDTIRRLALMGEGVVYKSGLDVAEDLRAGRLVQLCPDWNGEIAPLHLVSPGRRHLRPAMRALHAFLLERMEGVRVPEATR